jgi:hypothetical protein
VRQIVKELQKIAPKSTQVRALMEGVRRAEAEEEGGSGSE